MIEQQGRVLTSARGRARVRVGPVSGCPACDAGQGCGAGIFGRLLQRRPVTLEVDSDDTVQPGDQVRIGIPESLFLRLIGRLYLLPLISALAGAAFGHYVGVVAGANGGWMDACALFGAVVGGGLVLWRLHRGGLTIDRGSLRVLGAAQPLPAAHCVRRAAADVPSGDVMNR